MITEKCYDHLWSAVIADSTDPLFQVSLALQTPWATDLQPELTNCLFTLFPWVKAQGAVTSAVLHSNRPPCTPIQDRLTREISDCALLWDAGGAGDSPEERNLIHYEMDVDQREIGEEEPVDKLLAFLKFKRKENPTLFICIWEFKKK